MARRRPTAGKHRRHRRTPAGSALVLALTALSAFPCLATLDLYAPQYSGCGVVTVNGYVDTAPPADSLTWEWGDGCVTQSWFPATHHYAENDTYAVVVTASPTGETDQVSAVIVNAENPTCRYRVNVTPTWVLLRDGETTQQLTVEIQDAQGQILSNDDFTFTFASDNPAISVDALGNVSSSGFGSGWITVDVSGVEVKGRTRAVAGRFRVEPAVLYLSMDVGNTTGAITAYAENADGTAPGGSIAYVGGNYVATVNPVSGLVTALGPPGAFQDSPYFNASLGGEWTRNAAFVRVTSENLGLDATRYGGEKAVIWSPDAVCTYPYGDLIADLQVVSVLDEVYALEQWLTDVTPHDGGTQHLILDPGIDADDTVPCGLAGNPIRLGTGVDNCRSCFGGEDRMQWGIMAHEMGHNFMGQVAFGEFCSLLGGHAGDFSEGMATMLGVHAIDELVGNPSEYGLALETVADLSHEWTPLTPNNVRNVFYPELDAYEAAPDYADFNANLLDAILTQLHDQVGEAFFYRLLSAFYPPHSGLAVLVGTEAEALAFWAAACSAAAGTNLLGQFRDDWAFPLDEAFYHQVFARVRGLVIQRGPLLPHEVGTAAVFRVAPDGDVLADGTVRAAQFLTGSADVAEWVKVSESVEPGDVLELDPNVFSTYRLATSACSSLVTGVVSSSPGLVLGDAEARQPRALLALVGVVPARVANEGGPIMPGDLLVTSSTPGHAMRWAGPDPCPCALVGKALEPMTDAAGMILVLLTAH